MILILAVSGFASTSAGRSVEPLVGVIARDLRSDPHTVALLATAFALPYAFIQPILGPVADALGKERIFPICLGTLAVAMALCAAAPTIELLFALRILAGMAAGGVIPTSLGMIGDRVAMASRQVAISRFLAAVILGQLAGSSVSGLLAAWIGWRGVFGLAAALTAAAALGAILGFRESRRPPERLSLADALERYRRVLTNRRARFLYAFVFVDGMAFFGLMPYVAPNLEAHAEGGPFEAGLVLAGFALGGLLYSALVTWLLRVLGLGRMFVSGGCAAGAALLGLAFGHGWVARSGADGRARHRLLHDPQLLSDAGDGGRAGRPRLGDRLPRLLVLHRAGAWRRAVRGRHRDARLDGKPDDRRRHRGRARRRLGLGAGVGTAAGKTIKHARRH